MRRHAWHLKPAQEHRLTHYLEAFPVLHALYLAKQRLMRFLVLKTLTAKRAKKLMPRFLALLQQFSHSPAKALAATLTSWLEPIVGMWRFSQYTCITEDRKSDAEGKRVTEGVD